MELIALSHLRLTQSLLRRLVQIHQQLQVSMYQEEPQQLILHQVIQMDL